MTQLYVAHCLLVVGIIATGGFLVAVAMLWNKDFNQERALVSTMLPIPVAILIASLIWIGALS